ncbi:hypothetical protein NE619_04450 [Anaerovorax odorimutans]|uniref:Uncharacterized protein n=1 Tax=Anaerovorax odorimutans TaxID=109327 RepID=A0ABT1RLC1_9FIRM|nr:hypothetical protein [Anaerovorax odorimutans]
MKSDKDFFLAERSPNATESREWFWFRDQIPILPANPTIIVPKDDIHQFNRLRREVEYT